MDCSSGYCASLGCCTPGLLFVAALGFAVFIACALAWDDYQKRKQIKRHMINKARQQHASTRRLRTKSTTRTDLAASRPAHVVVKAVGIMTQGEPAR